MSRDLTFRSFLDAYPPTKGLTRPLDGVSVAEAVEERFGIDVPGALQFFWLRVGAGMFGDGELYIFGDESAWLPEPQLIQWNALAPWRPVYPEPRKGGPFYFAQTAFGDQLGFRWENKVALPELFMPETVESFVLAADLEELLCELLVTPGALCEAERLTAARTQLGPIPPGKHFVPVPSSNGSAPSYRVEPAEVHLAGAIERWRASRGSQQ
jgi:hypothetical protein